MNPQSTPRVMKGHSRLNPEGRPVLVLDSSSFSSGRQVSTARALSWVGSAEHVGHHLLSDLLSPRSRSSECERAAKIAIGACAEQTPILATTQPE